MPDRPSAPDKCRDMLALRFEAVRVSFVHSSPTLSLVPRSRSSSHAPTCLQVLYNIYSTTIQQLFNILFNNYSTTRNLWVFAHDALKEKERCKSFLFEAFQTREQP